MRASHWLAIRRIDTRSAIFSMISQGVTAPLGQDAHPAYSMMYRPAPLQSVQ